MNRALYWNICPNLHAMTDVGMAGAERSTQGETYSRPHTYNAECYGNKCRRRGKCLLLMDATGLPITTKTKLK